MGNILKRIIILRKKLNESVEKSGLNSKKTKEISKEINKLIEEYYISINIVEYPKNSKMITYYKKSYKALKNITVQLQKFPFVPEWNNFAKKYNCLSHISLEYIANLNWNYLKIKVERELNLDL